jgi:hypothetical protein
MKPLLLSLVALAAGALLNAGGASAAAQFDQHT